MCVCMLLAVFNVIVYIPNTEVMFTYCLLPEKSIFIIYNSMTRSSRIPGNVMYVCVLPAVFNVIVYTCNVEVIFTFTLFTCW